MVEAKWPCELELESPDSEGGGSCNIDSDGEAYETLTIFISTKKREERRKSP